MRRLIFILIYSIIATFSFGQVVSISGVVNEYYKVESVYTPDAKGIIIATGEDLSTLQPGDKVLLMQMSGVESGDTTEPSFPNSSLAYSTFYNAGKFELLYVKSVNTGTRIVEFTVNITASKFTTGEKIQLVKIFEAEYASVDGAISAYDWDGNKGGILALLVLKKLTLNNKIEVSNQGFGGASPILAYTGGCKSDASAFYYNETENNFAGKQGESLIQNGWPYTIGPGRNVTGGGGGLGSFAGGGGGGNWGTGGVGGTQLISCSSAFRSDFGINLDFLSANFYVPETTETHVTFGGGGGGSTQDATHLSSKGGDGGGLVLIFTDTLEYLSGGGIFSNGESVLGTVTGGGGGGGAGGTVLLDVNVYKNTLPVQVKGGNGGSTVNTTGGGAGGGGGGGLVWVANTTFPSSVLPNINSGPGGGNLHTNLRANPGLAGGTLTKLKLPLNGFLFNSIDGTDTVCEGNVPDIIMGSQPKGGTTYSFVWQGKTSTSWFLAPGVNNGKNYQPLGLTETTLFRRIVTSGSINDTSLAEEIFVYPAIGNNLLTNRDTLCTGQAPISQMSGGVVNGGDGTSYGYKWESTNNPVLWSGTIRSTQPSFTEGILTSTTYYRRLVNSTQYCSDTSNVDTLTVLSIIGNNTFKSADSAICNALDAGNILPNLPTGGDGIFRYQWLGSTDNSNFNNILGANQMNYSPGSLVTGNFYYKRTVMSGDGDVCLNTTPISYRIQVYPSLAGNSIITDSSRYCYADIPEIINGTAISGGDGSSAYIYHWISKKQNENFWNVIPGANTANYTPTTNFFDSVNISRVVLSGRSYYACRDTATPLSIDIIPQLFNTLVSPDTAICQNFTPLPFIETNATGGAGGYQYLWQSSINNTNWSSAPAANNLVSYTSGTLLNTTYFRRRVGSQICSSNSNSITINVYPSLAGNTINGADQQYTCFNSSKSLTSPMPSGGNGTQRNYFWEESLDLSGWNSAASIANQQNYSSVLLQDSIYFRRLVFSGNFNQCKDTSQPVLIRINPLPTGDIISNIDTACAESSIDVGYSLIGNGPWKVDLGDNTGVIYSNSAVNNANGIFNFNVDRSAEIKVLKIEDDSTCLANLNDNSGVISLKVYEVPVANAGNDDEVCGLIYTLNASPSVGTGLWTAQEVRFSDETDPLASTTAASYGSKEFTWTETNWECQSSAQTNIIYYEQPNQANAGIDQKLEYKFSATLQAIAPTAGSGYWEFIMGEGSFVDSTLYNTIVNFGTPENYAQVGNYTLRWTLINGVCLPVSDSMVVSITDRPPYNGFSPNDDGVNDNYVFELSGRYTSEVVIIDARGGKVTQLSGINEINWDGKNENGDVVPVGTYYFILTEKEINKTTSGYIELRK